MTTEDKNYINVEINMNGNSVPKPTYEYIYIDDFDKESVDTSNTIVVYSFKSESRRDELMEIYRDCEQEYIFVTLIEWPDEIRDEVESAGTERLRALEWAYAVLPYCDSGVESLPVLADQAESYLFE